MIEEVAKKIKSWKKGDVINARMAMKEMTFEIISKVLFGHEILSEMEMIETEDVNTGEKESLTFFKAFGRMFLD